MKIIAIVLASLLALVACDWFISKPAEAQEETTEIAPLPERGYSTLPGWSAGYRYNFNVDTQNLSKLRLFVKRKSHAGHVIKFGWERQTGAVPNFFKYGTIDGVSLNNTGILFIEQEYKF
jgi:hypothetical protein|tara:strand:- start:97 stop:456 length:360 start_codon:yes stop_codon:yes gene_type:complete